jgi:probable HAF family extracellular repeat protein
MMQDLNTLIFNGTTYVGTSDAEAINTLGEVVGKSDYAIGNSGVSSGHHHAYASTFANSAWTMTDLGALTGYSDSVATAINGAGEIVGTAGTGNSTAAFLYLNGQMIDLTSLLPANSGFTQLLTATGINDQGVIIGQGLTTAGSKDAYIFTYSAFTVPEPSTLVPMLLTVLVGVLIFRRRTRKDAQLVP